MSLFVPLAKNLIFILYIYFLILPFFSEFLCLMYSEHF